MRCWKLRRNCPREQAPPLRAEAPIRRRQERPRRRGRSWRLSTLAGMSQLRGWRIGRRPVVMGERFVQQLPHHFTGRLLSLRRQSANRINLPRVEKIVRSTLVLGALGLHALVPLSARTPSVIATSAAASAMKRLHPLKRMAVGGGCSRDAGWHKFMGTGDSVGGRAERLRRLAPRPTWECRSGHPVWCTPRPPPTRRGRAPA
jgi:hypothetical protein